MTSPITLADGDLAFKASAQKIYKSGYLDTTESAGLVYGAASIATIIPLPGEIGAVTQDGCFIPLRDNFEAGLYQSGYPKRVDSVLVDGIDWANAFPSAFMEGNRGYTHASPKMHDCQVLSRTVLDTEQDAVRNPGLLVASASLYEFPGRIGINDSGYEINKPGYPFTVTATWDSDAGKLSLASPYDYPITYDTTGGYNPSTAYSTPFSVSLPATVSFRVTAPDGRVGPVFGTVLGSPEASFVRSYPRVMYDDWDDTGTSMPPAGWEDTCGVAYRWTYGATVPSAPQPQLKSSAAVGTRVTGRFLPSPLVSGYLRVCAYRYGYSLSSTSFIQITVKIGKVSASWSKSGQTLTLSTPTTGATIKYSLDGSAPSLTYSAPLSILDTTTVKFKAEKTGLSASDTHTELIEYADGVAPDDFAEDYWTALPSEDITQTLSNVVFSPHPRPTLFASPSGTGDGYSAASPSTLQDIFDNIAHGLFSLVITWNSSAKTVSLTTSGPVFSSGFPVTFYYGATTPDTLLAEGATVSYASPAAYKFHVRRKNGVDVISQDWTIARITGTTDLAIAWDKTSRTITVTGAPANAQVYLGTQSTPTARYFGPVSVSATATFYVMLKTDCSKTTVYTIGEIDPSATLSFSITQTLTWSDNTGATLVKHFEPDCIWCTEGTHTMTSVPNLQGMSVYGGFDANFTIRDLSVYETIFTNMAADGKSCGINGSGSIYGIHMKPGTPSAGIYWFYHPYVSRYCNITVDDPSAKRFLSKGFNGTGNIPVWRVHDSVINITIADSASYVSTNFPNPDGDAFDGCLKLGKNISDTAYGASFYRCAINLSSAYSETGNVTDSTVNLYSAYFGSNYAIYPNIYPVVSAVRSSVNAEIDYSGATGSAGAELTATVAPFGIRDSDLIVSVIGANNSSGYNYAKVNMSVASGPWAIRSNVVTSVAAGSFGSGKWSKTELLTTGFFGGGSMDATLSGTYAGWVDTPRAGQLLDSASVTGTNAGVFPALTLDSYNQALPNNPANRYGWFGGTPNGPGGPLPGYEVAQGTGTQYGRYWE